jgi:non-specific serine/threonine protein kinase
MLTILRERLDAAGVAYEYLDGRTRDRQSRVDRFNSGTAPLFLISLKAGGTGLNLTGADYVIHYDPWWNPASEDQATDRAHRIGQTRQVFNYKLVARDTIEEKLIRLQGEKRELVRDLLETDGTGQPLTALDLEALFS